MSRKIDKGRNLKMLNNFVIVGRITKIESEKIENGANKTIVTLAVSRSFKNINGEYETDFIPCTLFGGVAETTKEYCKNGDLIATKGRVQTNNNKIELIAERVSFLTTRKEEDGE